MSDFAKLQELARAAGLQVNPPSVVDVPAVMPLEATVGTALTCTMGNWTGEPSEYLYSWTSNGVEVGTGASYTAAAGDAGHSLACVVTATNNVGSTTASPSNAVTVATAARAAPAHAAPAHDVHSDARRK
jgi:hypothetical protein